MQPRWTSWQSFEARVAPKHATETQFGAVRDQSPLLSKVIVAYGYGQVAGLVTSATNLLKAWADADTAFIRSPAKIKGVQSALDGHLALACRRIEELVLLAGNVSRLIRLLAALRDLRAIVGMGCHHNAAKIMPMLEMLAVECTHDVVEEHAGADRALSTELELHRFAPPVRRYFEEARDSLLLHHEELGAFAACRGFERGCKLVATTHSLSLVTGNAQPRPLADCDLNDVLEALSRSQWSDGSAVLDRTNRALVQFLRQMRNVAGHASTTSIDEWRETAVLAAAATYRLMERSAEPSQTIMPATMTRNW